MKNSPTTEAVEAKLLFNEKAVFKDRKYCIACKSERITVLDSGLFSEDPVRKIIESDPWGTSPLPFLTDQRWEFAECLDCNQKFQRKLLNEAWQEKRFTEWMSEAAIKQFEQLHGNRSFQSHFEKGIGFAKHLLRIEKATRSIRSGKPVRILDFGCGWGDFLLMAQQLGFESYGVDRSEGRQRVLRERGVVLFSDLQNIGKALGRSLHAVTLFQVMEHLEEPFALLAEIHKLMLPGAVLVIEVPNCEGVKGIKSIKDYRSIDPLDHINAFTPVSLRKIAERAGFKSFSPSAAFATTEMSQILKSALKPLVQRFAPTTNQYFKRV